MGLKIAGDVTTQLIERKYFFSTKKGQTFTMYTVNRPCALIQTFKGDRATAEDNDSLGKFHLDRIPPAPRGMPQVEVTVDIDANGMLNVSARDKSEVPCDRNTPWSWWSCLRHTQKPYCR